MNITTDKEAFEYIKNQLMNQGRRSITHEGCRYFISRHDADSDSDLKCAIGQIIDPKFYDENLEGDTAYDDTLISVIMASNPDWTIDVNSVRMLIIMQSIHDRSPVREWPDGFSHFSFDESGSFIEVDQSHPWLLANEDYDRFNEDYDRFEEVFKRSMKVRNSKTEMAQLKRVIDSAHEILEHPNWFQDAIIDGFFYWELESTNS